MIKYLMLLLALGALSVFLWFNPGVVTVQIAGLHIIISLWFFMAMMVLFWVMLSLVWRLLCIPSWLRHRRERNHDKRQLHQFDKALGMLSQGQFKWLHKHAHKAWPNTLLGLIADMCMTTPVALTTPSGAEKNNHQALIFWLEGLGQMLDHRFDAAVMMLNEGLHAAPKHMGILNTLAHAYACKGDWTSLYTLIDAERARLKPGILAAYEIAAYDAQLNATLSTPVLFEQTWSRVPKALKQSPRLEMLYIKYLKATQAHRKLKNHLEQVLVVRACDEALTMYLALTHVSVDHKLTKMKLWLAHQPKAPELLMGIAQLYEALDQLELAQMHYQQCFQQAPSLKTGFALVAFDHRHYPEKVNADLKHITGLMSL